MFRWQLLAVVVSSACIKPAVGWQIPASSRKTFLFWIPSVMGPLSLHGVSVFLFQSHIHFLMGNSHLCLFLASDLFILQMVLRGPAAKRFLGPSAAEVDSEQELFKGHVGPPTSLLASGHIISLLLASHFLLLLSSCLENNVFCASCPWLCWPGTAMLGGGRKQRAPQSLLLSVHLGVVTPCPSPLREGDVAQSRV